MKHLTSQRLRVGLAALTAAWLLPAMAAAPSLSPYQRERDNCLQGRTNQDQRTCLQEANAARDQMRRGLLQTEAAATLQANALRRCDVHRIEDDRQACIRMVKGEGEVSGTASGGGVMRAYTTVTIGPVPAASPPASSPR